MLAVKASYEVSSRAKILKPASLMLIYGEVAYMPSPSEPYAGTLGGAWPSRLPHWNDCGSFRAGEAGKKTANDCSTQGVPVPACREWSHLSSHVRWILVRLHLWVPPRCRGAQLQVRLGSCRRQPQLPAWVTWRVTSRCKSLGRGFLPNKLLHYIRLNDRKQKCPVRALLAHLPQNQILSEHPIVVYQSLCLHTQIIHNQGTPWREHVH